MSAAETTKRRAGTTQDKSLFVHPSVLALPRLCKCDSRIRRSWPRVDGVRYEWIKAFLVAKIRRTGLTMFDVVDLHLAAFCFGGEVRKGASWRRTVTLALNKFTSRSTAWDNTTKHKDCAYCSSGRRHGHKTILVNPGFLGDLADISMENHTFDPGENAEPWEYLKIAFDTRIPYSHKDVHDTHAKCAQLQKQMTESSSSVLQNAASKKYDALRLVTNKRTAGHYRHLRSVFLSPMLLGKAAGISWQAEAVMVSCFDERTRFYGHNKKPTIAVFSFEKPAVQRLPGRQLTAGWQIDALVAKGLLDAGRRYVGFNGNMRLRDTTHLGQGYRLHARLLHAGIVSDDTELTTNCPVILDSAEREKRIAAAQSQHCKRAVKLWTKPEREAVSSYFDALDELAEFGLVVAGYSIGQAGEAAWHSVRNMRFLLLSRPGRRQLAKMTIHCFAQENFVDDWTRQLAIRAGLTQMCPVLADKTAVAQRSDFNKEAAVLLIEKLQLDYGLDNKQTASAIGLTPQHVSNLLSGRCGASLRVRKAIDNYYAPSPSPSHRADALMRSPSLSQ